MEENNILFENQFGFRKQNSTVHALIQMTEQVRYSIANINKLIVLQKKTVRMMTFNENHIGFQVPSARTSPII